MDKLKCPLRNFQNCLEKECAFFISDFYLDAMTVLIDGKEYKVPPQPIFVNHCLLFPIGLAASEIASKLYTERVERVIQRSGEKDQA